MYRLVPEKVEVATIFGDNRYLAPFNRGIATPVCALVRNDRKLEGEAVQTPIYRSVGYSDTLISLILISFPFTSQVRSLPQWGQIRPWATVG